MCAKLLGLFVLFQFSLAAWATDSEDPYLWLENLDGKESMSWVLESNRKTDYVLERSREYNKAESDLESLFSNNDYLPQKMFVRGEYLYSFKKGNWQRILKRKYSNGIRRWRTLFSVEEISNRDRTEYEFKSVNCQDVRIGDRCLVNFSVKGKDAVVVKEFDLKRRRFLLHGFSLPEGRTETTWVNHDTIFLTTSLIKDGGTLRLWKRGQDFNKSYAFLEAPKNYLGVVATELVTTDDRYILIILMKSWMESEYYIYRYGEKIKLNIPTNHSVEGLYQNFLLLRLKSDWEMGENVYKKDSLVGVNFSKLLEGEILVQTIYSPKERTVIEDVQVSKDYIILNLLENVKGKIRLLERKQDHAGELERWESHDLDLPDNGTTSIYNSTYESNEIFLTFENFLTPQTLYYKPDDGFGLKVLKKVNEKFSSQNLAVKQYEVKSADGTSIPYFLVGSKNLENDGQNPTLLYGYGGFEYSMRPYYSGIMGRLWLEKGGVYVLANIRGGGEFGSRWHLSATRENRQKAYDDFIAVAEDLIKRGITSPQHLGISGASNGGLLAGAVMVQRPELFNAVISKVPLLDMLRFDKLLVGHYWVDEYGDPDVPEDYEFLKKYSPYHNVLPDVDYPKMLLMTSTKDDRVHPAHARKMAAKMEDLGHEVLFYENTEDGGHGGATSYDNVVKWHSLQYAFLYQQLF